MVSTFASAAVVTINGRDYDPIDLQVTKDANWSPRYQATCTLAVADLVAPTLKADRNLVTNPSAFLDLFDAVGTACTVTRQAPAAGIASAHGTAYRLTGNGSSIFGNLTIGGGAGGLRLGMVAGQTYNVSGTFYLDSPMGGTANAYARSLVVNVVVGGTQSILAASAQAPNVAGQTRLAVSFTIPAGATACWVEYYHGHASTSVCYWTDLKLSDGSGVEPDGTDYQFWDGDSQSTSRYAYSWTGVAHRSSSIRAIAFASTSTTPIADPREYPKVRLRQWAGASADTAADAPLYDVLLTLRTWAFDDVADTATLTFMSDEIKLQDYKNAGDDYAPGPMGLVDMVSFAARKIGEPRFVPAPSIGNPTIPATATLWRTGQSLDDWLRGAANSVGFELWYDAVRRLGVGGVPEASGWQWLDLSLAQATDNGYVTGIINSAYGANVLESGHGIDMDSGDYADAVAMVYQWVDTAGANQRVAYYSRPNGAFHKVKSITRNTPAPGGNPATAYRNHLALGGWTQRIVLIASNGFQKSGASAYLTIQDFPLGGTLLTQRRDGSYWRASIARIAWSYPADTQEIGVSNVQAATGGAGTDFALIPIPAS